MSYADAAHHAPTTSDPTPDHSLLVSTDSQPSNPDAKHVKVAPQSSEEPLPHIVPQKRESENQQPTAAASNASSASQAATTSNGKKSGKKGKKNKKETLPASTAEKDEGGKEPAQVEAVKEKKSDDEVRDDSKGDRKKDSDKGEVKQVESKKNEKEDKKEVEKKESRASKEAETKPSPTDSTSNDDGKQKKPEQKKGEEEPAGKGFETELKSRSESAQLPTVSKDLDQKLADPYVPRANIAASVEHPQGTTENDYAKKHKDESVLQQHVGFFDRDNDGVIWPTDTFVGFHTLGYSLVWCILAVFLIHPTFSYFTLSSWIPDPFFRIRVKSIHRAKHGSDTGVYDSQGRFVSAKFEEIFEKFDKNKKGGLTFLEGLFMLRENRNVLDPVGWIGAFFEWFASYLLIWPKNGVVTKEDLRTIYDGSLFYAVAEKESTVRARQHHFYSGWFKENRSDDINKFNKKIQ